MDKPDIFCYKVERTDNGPIVSNNIINVYNFFESSRIVIPPDADDCFYLVLDKRIPFEILERFKDVLFKEVAPSKVNGLDTLV